VANQEPKAQASHWRSCSKVQSCVRGSTISLHRRSTSVVAQSRTSNCLAPVLSPTSIHVEHTACADFQPGCKVSWNEALVGRDVRTLNLSWAQAAGGAIATASKVDRWTRAIFEGEGGAAQAA
jgi:hypothetical protein